MFYLYHTSSLALQHKITQCLNIPHALQLAIGNKIPDVDLQPHRCPSYSCDEIVGGQTFRQTPQWQTICSGDNDLRLPPGGNACGRHWEYPPMPGIVGDQCLLLCLKGPLKGWEETKRSHAAYHFKDWSVTIPQKHVRINIKRHLTTGDWPSLVMT